MRIITSIDNIEISEKTAVALGNFDGIHIGHQKIMEAAVTAAKESCGNGTDAAEAGTNTGTNKETNKNMKSLCFTFSNHPFNYILNRDAEDPAAVKLICSEEEKIRLIEDMGFDILVNVPFDDTIMKMRAHDFFADIIAGRLNAGFISVGFNYSYGARAEGSPELLKKECGEAGIGIKVREAVTIDGTVVSSTLIREKISEGNMELAAEYLGRPLSFSGSVSHGKHLGSEKGFPTANIVPGRERMLPPRGVYFSRTEVDGRMYNSVSNIGIKPTVQSAAGGEAVVSIETNLFGFEGNLYGRELSVFFDHFSRGEVRFSSKDELFSQIAKDCANAAAYYDTEKMKKR